jgi:hypothetical protein
MGLDIPSVSLSFTYILHSYKVAKGFHANEEPQEWNANQPRARDWEGGISLVFIFPHIELYWMGNTDLCSY